MATKITIDKKYFETLLRKANHAAASQEDSYSDSTAVACVPKNEYNVLLKMRDEFARLKAGLQKLGFTIEHFEKLILETVLDDSSWGRVELETECTGSVISENTAPTVRSQSATKLSAKATPWKSAMSTTMSRSGYGTTGSQLQSVNAAWNKPLSWRSGTASEHSALPSSPSFHSLLPTSHSRSPERHFDGSTKHVSLQTDGLPSLDLFGVPSGTSLANLLSHVRGGSVLEIMLSRETNAATLCFVEPDAASTFLAHSRRYGLWLQHQRVAVSWSKKFNKIPPSLATRIKSGMTRNLCISNLKEGLTSDSIRDHLEHIDGLEVVGVELENGNAYVSTNSIDLAITAQRCLLSRADYEGRCRITWYPDECAQPYSDYLGDRTLNDAVNGVPAVGAKISSGKNKGSRFKALRLRSSSGSIASTVSSIT